MIKKLLLIIGAIFASIWIGFWLYKQYSLQNFNIENSVREGRIVEIRGRWYAVDNINRYPILLVSDNNGQTWYEKNIRGIWNVFPLFDNLQLNSPLVDIISVKDVIYIIGHFKYSSWDNSTGFYIRYISKNEGKNWSNNISLDTLYLIRNEGEEQYTYQYGIYDNGKEQWFNQDKLKVIKP